MRHSKDCTAGLSDIDPTCEACIAQRLERSRGYPPFSKQGPILIVSPCGCRVDHGIPTRCNEHALPQARAGVTPLGQCIAEQYFQDDEEWADYVRDMDLLPPWNEGIE